MIACFIRKCFALLLLFVVAEAVPVYAGTWTSAQDRENFIQTSDLLNIRQLMQITPSPDGSKVVYVVREIVSDNNGYTYRDQLWLVPADGSRSPVQLTFHLDGARQPAWHPDGSKIAFTRTIDGTSRIFILPLDGGEARVFSPEKLNASSPSWSPTGDKLLFAVSKIHSDLLAEDGTKDGPPWPDERPDGFHFSTSAEPDPDGDIEQVRAWLHQNEKDHSPAVLNRIDFQGEHNLNPELSYTQWYIMRNEEDAEAEALTSGYFSFTGASWAPDSRSVILSGNTQTDQHPDRVMEAGLYKVDLSNRQLRSYTKRVHYRFTNPEFSPDGRFIAFQAFDTRERGYSQTEIGLLEVRTGDISLHGSSIDRNFGNLHWSYDSRFVYAVAPTNGGFPLYRMHTRTGEFEKITDTETGIRDFALTENRIVYALTTMDNPFELYTAGLRNESPRKISNHNDWISDRKISRATKHVTVNDDLEIEYWVMKPAGYQEGQTYPTVLQIHGGPSAMWGKGEASMWHEFQLFAAHGFGVVYSNPRGSGGYGYDFQKANHQDWGDGPMRDVLAALDDAVSIYDWIDESRLTITGGSYGGYLVAYTIAMDHRFVAAAAQRGVYDLVTFLGEGNAYRLVNDRFGGYPWDEDIYPILRRESPINYVHEIRTPLLIKHGDNDLRTGVSQSEMLYRSLKLLDREVEYVRYPGAGHDLSRTGNPEHRMDRLLRMIEFMRRYTD